MNEWSAFGLATVMSLTAGVGCKAKEVPAGSPKLPDVVLVSIDTLRADHLGCYGYERATSPFIDGLAQRGTRFEHARSPSPWTLPSHVTMLSGWLPHRHLAVEDDIGIADDVPLLAETMAAEGYATGGFTSTLYVSRTYGFERGFDAFDDFGIDSSKKNLKGEVTATDVVDRALRWLKEQRPGAPVFLFLHFYDTHYAYDPPAPYDTMFDRAPAPDDPSYRKYHHYLEHPLEDDVMAHQVAQYDEAIRYVDAELERLHGAMTGAGRSATWVVTSDHGEEFGERGSWGHAHTLYPEQLRVPLVITPPLGRTGTVEKTVVGLQDLARFVALLPSQSGASLELERSFDSPHPGATSRVLVSDTSRFSTKRIGLWQDGWRLDLDVARGHRELYDTRTDPHERQDVASQHPERVQALEADLWSALGTPWECVQAGPVRARKGRLVRDGALLEQKAELNAGARFQVYPTDAWVSHGSSEARFRAGETYPRGEAPLAYHGSQGRAVSLTPEERAQLEALGYLQGEEPAE